MDKRERRLTAVAVERIKEPGYYHDGAGLYLQVSRTCSKSWIFRFTLAGKSREMGIGGYPVVSLAAARSKARECRGLLDRGIDPIEDRNAKRQADRIATSATTFDQCATAYITAHRPSWKNAKHAAQWESTLATYCSPVFGALPVRSVDTPMVLRVLQPIWLTKAETANRLRGRIESILDWATVQKYRAGENPARWRGHLEHLLAAPNRTKRIEHHPALPWQEIGAFMVELRQQAGIAARAMEFAILTAARSGEVRLAAWSEIDLDSRIWTVPADRMKAGKEHRVPLSDGAVSLLQSMHRVVECDLIFPGAREGRPLSDMSLTACLRRMNRGDITVHGFRSTFRDWCAESANFPREVCEHALAHSLPDKVEAAYRRGDLLDKRVLLMQEWNTFCSKTDA